MQAQDFREIVSGRRRGLAAAATRGLLAMAEWPYTWAVMWRNRRYDRRADLVTRVSVPVVSVGNLTLGGTGKTPMVEWLARWFRGQGVRVAIVSRGYGAVDGHENDEALQLEENLPDVPHLENPRRIEAAHLAIEELASQLILLDDGFQHRRLGRDLDIVLLDALEPFGHRRVFPRGLLREPLAGLRRADVVALSRADLLAEDARRAIQDEVARWNPQALWIELAHQPRRLLGHNQPDRPADAWAGRRVAAFCGLGHPEGFRRTLAGLDYRLCGFREFPDHHAYSAEDVTELGRWAQDVGAEALVCTQKDFVKLRVAELAGLPLGAVAIEMAVLTNEAAFVARLAPLADVASQYDHGSVEKYESYES